MMRVVSMRGRVVDMAALMAANSHKVALGNAGFNARGDRVIGPGNIVATREQMMQDYNVGNPRAVKQVGLSGIGQEVMASPQPEPESKHTTEAKLERTPRRKIADSE